MTHTNKISDPYRYTHTLHTIKITQHTQTFHDHPKNNHPNKYENLPTHHANKTTTKKKNDFSFECIQWFWFVWIVIITPLIRIRDFETMVARLDERFGDAMKMRMTVKSHRCSPSDPVGVFPQSLTLALYTSCTFCVCPITCVRILLKSIGCRVLRNVC